MRKLMLALLMLGLLVLPRVATARPVHFFGQHPIAQKFGGGYCYLDGPHIHVYAPDHAQLYHDVGGELVFTADPTPFGYEGPHYTFYGAHPVPGVPGVVYCYIQGPHYHPYGPPDGADYRLQGNVAFYIGNYDPVYYRERPHREKQYATIYRPYVAARPVVEVTPPPEWHGEVWIAPPSVEVRAGVAVPPPPAVVVQPAVVAPPPPMGPVVHVRAAVAVPPPPVAGVSVHVQAPGVYIAPPPPPSVHVRIGAPPPVVVAPQPVYVGAPPPQYYRHDNGRHEGWYKHGEHEHGDHRRDERWGPRPGPSWGKRHH